MAGRIRTLKPEWLDDEKMAMASIEARLLSVALILLADDHGRGRAHPAHLGGSAFTYSGNPAAAAQAALDELVRIEFVRLYTVRGQSYFEIRTWAKHQRVDRPSAPRVPPPDVTPEAVTVAQEAKNIEESPLARVSRETREGLATDLRSPISDPDPATPPPAYASKLAETVGEALATGGLTGNKPDMVELANKCAAVLARLEPAELWKDLPAEAALWVSHAQAKALEQKAAGNHWNPDRVFHEVLTKCQSRARYRPSDARKEREATRVAKASQSARGGAFQGTESAIDWGVVRREAEEADREQARRAAKAAASRDAVDPKAMAETVRRQLEKLTGKKSA